MFLPTGMGYFCFFWANETRLWVLAPVCFLGLNPDTETVAVGIRVQDRRDGIHHVGPADGLRHLPKPMISLVKVLTFMLVLLIHFYLSIFSFNLITDSLFTPFVSIESVIVEWCNLRLKWHTEGGITLIYVSVKFYWCRAWWFYFDHYKK